MVLESIKLAQAGKMCKGQGGQLFAPSDESEINQLREVARRKAFGLKLGVQKFSVFGVELNLPEFLNPKFFNCNLKL